MACMGFAGWTAIHWIDLLQSTGILAGLLFTAYNIRSDSRDRKIHSVFALTEAHRDIWSKVYEHPNLASVLRPEVNAESFSVSNEQELFVHLLILHLAASYQARKLGMYFQEDGLRLDIREFFSLPIPKAVWEKSKVYQDHDFVKFVESCVDRLP
jgi:hypothetical protein